MVRTRFAPSPTGYLHIGGVRTALFNWLYARKHGGEFILRIDDTDQQRNLEEALQPILDGFDWLGLDYDEGPGKEEGPHGPYFQSKKGERYQHAVQALLDKGLAYHDYSTAEEREAERKEAEANKAPYVASRKWMAEKPSQRKKFEAEGREAAVRLKMPREGACQFHDHIRGDVEVPWASEQEHVIQRSDGSVLYSLASVVDDYDMAITHVIRAEEHLSNTPRQIFIAQGLDYDLPEYAHIPFVAEPGSSKKLSKRKIATYLNHPSFKKVQELGESILKRLGLEVNAEQFNPVMVEFYKRIGYRAQAVLNGLLMLGWAYDDKKEIFSREEMIELFTLEKVNKSPASFDPDKLTMRFQEHYMQELNEDQRTTRVRPFLEQVGLMEAHPTLEEIDYLVDVVKAAGDRIKVAGQILDFDYFFLADDAYPYDEKAFEKRLRKPEGAKALLTKFKEKLAAAEDFEEGPLEQLMKEFVEAEGIKLGDIIHAVRVAVTGQGVGCGMFETLAILGKERCLNRIDRTLKELDGDG